MRLRCRRSDLGQSKAKIIRKSECIVGGAREMTTKANSTVGSPETLNAALDFRTEMSHQALDRPCSGVTQCTDRTTFDLFSESSILASN